MSQGPRPRLIAAAISLVQEKGVEGSGLSELLERSNTARRSLYQHFPGGKHDLIGQATRTAGRFVELALRDAAGLDTTASLAIVVDMLVANVEEADFRLSCPVAAAAAAPADATTVIAAAGAAFADWVGVVEQKLVGDGLPPAEAHSLAGFLVSSLEGALLCARAARSAEPLQQAREQLTRLLADRLPAGPTT